MSFVADISVPKETGLVVVQTGDAAPTQAECLARAWFSAGVYYVKDIGYLFASIQVFEVCDVCEGSGKVSKTRGRRKLAYAWKPCKVCNERGFWPVGSPERVSLEK